MKDDQDQGGEMVIVVCGSQKVVFDSSPFCWDENYNKAVSEWVSGLPAMRSIFSLR